MIPFYVFYSMFGFQRVGDLAWAAGDSRARGFLVGGTAGRTTLNGEGLQHEDGHSHVLASVIPNCVAYDPTYAYELGVIVREGLRRMCTEQEDVFYYLTVMNENYVHPPMPDGAEEGILRGMYLLREAPEGDGPRVQLLGSGSILREVEAAAELLASGLLGRGRRVERDELHRAAPRRARGRALEPAPSDRAAAAPLRRGAALRSEGPAVASTDYIRTFADQIRPYVPGRYVALGTDGFGRSDYRVALRRFFEVDRHHVAVAALKALADEGAVEPSVVASAIERYAIEADAAAPWTR